MNVWQQKTSKLYDEHVAIDFYQERYAHGYMDEWPDERKERIAGVIRSLELPDKGEALDFGCGNGVLTDVIRRALPFGWKVYGTDISAIAIENAKVRYPDCTFFVAGDNGFVGKRFDFLFTHHVLEHVYNLTQAFDEMNGFLKAESAMLHILPCGNEGSFEHSVCLLRKDGINQQLENRFFFEDEGHVRRLNTEQLCWLGAEKGFDLTKEYYSNQYYGAIEWITQSGQDFVRVFTDTSSAKDEEARRKLKRLRYKLLVISAFRSWVAKIESRLNKRNKTLKNYAFLIGSIPLYLFVKPIDSYWKMKAREEWQKKKMERNGSEMYLFFKSGTLQR